MREYFKANVVAVYITDENGVPTACDVVDHLGVSLLTGQAVEAPQVIGTIADRVYTQGAAAVTIDLTTKFSGGMSYDITPKPTGVSISGATVTINPTATMAQTTLTASATNAGGTATVAFDLTVNAVAPTLTSPLSDVSLTVGDPNAVIDLTAHFANAATYQLAPTGQGVSISGTNLTVSGAAERTGTYTVTARNSTGQEVADSFDVTVAAAQVAPTLSGGSLTFVDGDLILTSPTASGDPAPTVTLTSLTRNGSDVTGELTANTIEGAAAGDYEAVWTASNGVNPDATATRTLTVGTAPTITQQPSITADGSDAGAIVTLDVGTATGDPAPSYEVAWYIGAALQGDTGLTFDTTGRPGDISAQVTWDNAVGSVTGTSNTITIAAVPNRAPVAPAIGAQSLIVGEAYNLNAAFTDPDGDNLTYSFVGTLPQGVTRTGAVFSGTPTTAESVSGTLTADDGELTADLVINWTVTADAGTELEYDPDATVVINSDDGTETTFTVTDPAEYADTYTVTNADFATGPVNVVAPVVSGNPLPGDALTVDLEGLWVYDSNAAPIDVVGQWHRDGAPINGATGLTYTLQVADVGADVTYRETATDGNGTRFEPSNAITVNIPGVLRDTFTAPDGTLLSAYVGESGYSWDQYGSERAQIDGGILRSGTSNNYFFAKRNDPVGNDHSVKARYVHNGATDESSTWPAVRVNGSGDGVFARYSGNNTWRIYAYSGGVAVQNLGGYGAVHAAGQEVELELKVVGTQAELWVDGVLGVSNTLNQNLTGAPGIASRGSTTGRGLTDYGVEDLS